MIRVKKKGKIPPARKSRIKKCRYCKTVFAYDKEDIQILGHDSDSCFYGVECPICKIVIITNIYEKTRWNRLKKYNINK